MNFYGWTDGHSNWCIENLSWTDVTTELIEKLWGWTDESTELIQRKKPDSFRASSRYWRPAQVGEPPPSGPPRPPHPSFLGHYLQCQPPRDQSSSPRTLCSPPGLDWSASGGHWWVAESCSKCGTTAAGGGSRKAGEGTGESRARVLEEQATY